MKGAFMMSPNMRNHHQASCQAASLGAGMLPTLSHLPPSLSMDRWVLVRPLPPQTGPGERRCISFIVPISPQTCSFPTWVCLRPCRGRGEKRAGFRETAQQQAAHRSERSHTWPDAGRGGRPGHGALRRPGRGQWPPHTAGGPWEMHRNDRG